MTARSGPLRPDGSSMSAPVREVIITTVEEPVVVMPASEIRSSPSGEGVKRRGAVLVGEKLYDTRLDLVQSAEAADLGPHDDAFLVDDVGDWQDAVGIPHREELAVHVREHGEGEPQAVGPQCCVLNVWRLTYAILDHDAQGDKACLTVGLVELLKPLNQGLT